MTATGLLVWGLALHTVIDWLCQNNWVALNKAKPWHPAGHLHGAMHGAVQLLIFPWWVALLIGVTHYLIDTRVPVEWWARLFRQARPDPYHVAPPSFLQPPALTKLPQFTMLVDMGTLVRMAVDQAWHLATIMAAVGLATL